MTAIWNGASTTPAATHRVPVDVSSSGSPTRWTGQQIADLRAYVGGTVNNLGSIGTNQSLSLADGLYIAATITGNVQFTFTSVPTGFTDLFLELTNAGAHTVSFAATIGWTGGTTPSLPAVGVALIHLYTRDGGTSYIAHLVSDEQQFDAAAIVSGTVATARLGSGTANSTVVLRGDQTWGAPPAGGSDTQVLFNDGGTLAGDSGFTFNKTNNTVDLGGATVTASDPVMDLSQTWNSSGVTFTGLRIAVTNTASASDSRLVDLSVSGTSKLRVLRDGSIYYGSGADGNVALASGSFNTFALKARGQASIYVSDGDVKIGSSFGASLGFVAGAANGTADVRLIRDAAGVLAQRNGTNAQTFRIYRSYTDASNYSRWTVKWNTSTAILQAEGAGTGTNGSTAFNDAALATNATVGFLMIPSCAGTPTGTPADIPTGQSPIVYDSTNKKLCVWDGAAWVQTAALT